MIAKKRLILYIIGFFLLVITSTIVILLGQGYYFDFKNLKIKKLGMIAIRSTPRNVNVFLDNKFKKNKTPLNIPIFPGNYEIKIEKDNYITWHKTVNVESGEVTWLYNVFLILKNRPSDYITNQGIKKSKISPDFNKIAFLDLKNNLWLAELKNNYQKKIYSPEEEQNLKIIDWSKNGKSILISVDDKEKQKYKLIKDSKLLELKNLPPKIEKIEFIKNSDDKFFALSESYLYYIDENTSQIKEDNISTFSQNSENLFFVKKTNLDNEIWKTSFDFNTKDLLIIEKNNIINLFPGEKRFCYTLEKSNELIFLENEKKEKINSGVLEVKWSKKDKKIAYRTLQEIYIHTFESDNPKEPRDIITTRLSKPISQIFWFFDSNHIVFKTEKEINFIEPDGDNSITLTDLADPEETFAVLKNGKSLIFVEKKENLKNIKIMKLAE